MCTTNNSTKKRVARACKPARNTITHLPKNSDERDIRTTWGRNCRIVESQRHKRHHSPRLDKNAAMCSKEIDVLIPHSR